MRGFVVVALSLMTGYRMRAPAAPDRQTAQRTVESVSLDACPFPRGRSTTIQLYVAFDRHGTASHVEVGRDVEGSLAECLVASIKGARLPPGEWEGATEVTFEATVETDGNGRTRWPFDRDAGEWTLGTIEATSGCTSKKSHLGHLSVVFDGSGKVSSAKVDEDITLTPETVRCIEAAFLRARVPPFAGPPVSVGKWFLVEESRR